MTSWALLIIGTMLFVAYANGANDNFKGVATLFGSGVAGYRTALWWGTAATAAGSIAAFFLATSLISVFQGNGLVPTALLQSPPFLAAVIFGAAVTVFAATQIGMPISTTHGLIGAWVGGGLAAAGINLGFVTLVQSFFLPLLISPLIALVLIVSDLSSVAHCFAPRRCEQGNLHLHRQQNAAGNGDGGRPRAYGDSEIAARYCRPGGSMPAAFHGEHMGRQHPTRHGLRPFSQRGCGELRAGSQRYAQDCCHWPDG
jgi:phosphate/sulfate permease